MTLHLKETVAWYEDRNDMCVAVKHDSRSIDRLAHRTAQPATLCAHSDEQCLHRLHGTAARWLQG